VDVVLIGGKASLSYFFANQDLNSGNDTIPVSEKLIKTK
jgi:hypothetical protein